MARIKARAMPNFSVEEFACNCGCNSAVIAPGFDLAMQGLRDACGFALPVTSVCRCPAHNKLVGGHYRSLHLTKNTEWKLFGTEEFIGTCAADFAFPEGHPNRQVLIDRMWERGWSVGLHPKFVHGDLRTTYLDRPQAKFTY